MRQLPALDMSSNVTKFWRSYVDIGVLTYSLGASAVLIYSLTTPGPHRQAMVILSGLSLVASVAGFRLLGLRLVHPLRNGKVYGRDHVAEDALLVFFGWPPL